MEHFHVLLMKYSLQIKLVLIFIRYAIQLLTPSSQNAKMNGHGSILRIDIEETTSLFMHAKESCKILKKCADKFMK